MFGLRFVVCDTAMNKQNAIIVSLTALRESREDFSHSPVAMATAA
jgi:hypothetical protein